MMSAGVLRFFPVASYLIPAFSLPSPDMIHRLHQQETPPRIIKAVSLIIHSPLLFIHFYHAQSSFLALQTFLFHSMLFTHSPSICGLPLNLIPLTLDHTILFTNQSSFILSMCPTHVNTHCSAQPANSVTAVLIYTSFLIRSKHTCSTDIITFNLSHMTSSVPSLILFISQNILYINLMIQSAFINIILSQTMVLLCMQILLKSTQRS